MQKPINIREAERSDVPAITALFTDDILGRKREAQGGSIAPSYYEAFEAINADKNNLMIVAEIDGVLVGTLQITYVTNMSHQGAKRVMIEGVHVDSSRRNLGIGKYMMDWTIDEARKNGCRFVQLTSNKERPDAHRFYERLGFEASHEGFKLDLEKKNETN